MSQFEQFMNQMGKAWEVVAEGWQQLSKRAPHALTAFRDPADPNPLGIRWTLLPGEVIEYPEVVVAKLEVPGMTTEGLELFVEAEQLVISGQKTDSAPPTPGQSYLHEIAYGVFERRLPLPCRVDDHAAKAEYRHGVLLVTLPKAVAPAGQRVRIETA